MNDAAVPDIESWENQKDQITERVYRIGKKTPMAVSQLVNKLAGASIHFKCENLQAIGAFKIRGASNAILKMDARQLSNGVATHSSGNHAQAVARVAQHSNIPAHIVMPNNSPQVKIDAVKSYGAQTTFCEPNLAAREQNLNSITKATGAAFVPPYDHADIILGQATCAEELLQNQPDLDAIIIPVGGGGLLAGSALAAKAINPQIKIYGAEPLTANDCAIGIKYGKRNNSIIPNTICDGLRTYVGVSNFEIIQKHVNEILEVPDNETKKALLYIYQYLKQVVEPSAAIGLAAVLNHQHLFQDKKVGVILTGGNIDLYKLNNLLP